MTRTFTSHPVWTWKCDYCGYQDYLAWEQKQLPSPMTMRSRGWFIAEKFGDTCPACVAENGDAE